ncbi:MAG: hypothetical protein QOD27_1057 [Microbacteriaceae bacterium]|nr:hypothetical protein [Microbacteriaceae bacterium]
MNSFDWDLESDGAHAPDPIEVPTHEPREQAPMAISRRALRENETKDRASAKARTPRVVKSAKSPRNSKARSPKGRSPKARSPKGGTPQGAPQGPGRAITGRKSVKRAVLSKLVTIGAMLGVGALMISTSLPANAFFNAVETDYTTVQATESQSIKVASDAVEKAATRDSYTVTSLASQLRLKYGNRNFSYTNNVNGTIQWPFPVPVPISSGFGPRTAPCGGCSSMHQGIDFTPGSGVVIDSIADGVVSQVIASHAGLGNHIIIDHVINGQKVQSVYAHMLDGSFKVTVGQLVTVAQPIGEVGSTGESTGAHLHFEIHLNGVPVDPFAWLKANAN